MTQATMYYGGLVFEDTHACALDRLCRIVTATLEDYAHPVDRQSILNRRQARILSSHYMVKLALAEPVAATVQSMTDDGPSQRFEITLYPLDSEVDDRDTAQMMLAVMLYRMVDVFPALSVEWLHPETELEIDQFLSAFGGISAHRRHPRQDNSNADIVPFAQTDVPQDAMWGKYGNMSGHCMPQDNTDLGAIGTLQDRNNIWSDHIQSAQQPTMSEQQAQNDIRRLATWGMTGMVAFLSAPVALSMAAVNLARGEDFRLNTHVLSLTGLLVMLQSSGALASVVSRLPM